MSQNLWTHIRTVSDFPKAGIEFYDISPLLNQHLNQLIDALIDALPSDILAATDALVAVESRGFVLASLLAARLDKGLILIRKTGKLPPPCPS
ncbi:Adenine phosphoribosyltransferase [Moraxella catarrhalis]|nr:Adenine phosphoribosyltransferase [Moraxella catarrhalis]